MPALSFLFAGSFKKYRAIDAAEVAKAMLAAAQSGKAGVNIYEYTQIKMLSAQ